MQKAVLAFVLVLLLQTLNAQPPLAAALAFVAIPFCVLLKKEDEERGDNFNYGAFGEENGAPDEDATPFRYTGRWGGYTDRRLGWTLNWHRWYGPSAGRWINQDPLRWNSSEISLYRYSFGNPIRYVDGTGKDAWATGEGSINAALTFGGSGGGGVAVNLQTGEACAYIVVCFRAGLGFVVSAGFKAGLTSGPSCGSQLSGININLVGEIVSPTGGVGGSIGTGVDLQSGHPSGVGVGVGLGPEFGAGIFGGVEGCVLLVIKCWNTPKKCRGCAS